jgi:glycosyltransferase involved in cell wall biosynthesis/GT2 family glycosyltransferase
MSSVVLAVTCHGRPTTTLAALRAAARQALPADVKLTAVLVEDDPAAPVGRDAGGAFSGIKVIAADGTQWWGGAIRRALDVAAATRPNFLLWLNDDVKLDPDALARLLATYEDGGGIVVGATRDPATGARSYGGQIRTSHPFRFAPVPVTERPAPCDTFQGNVVLVPFEIHERLGGVDPAFVGAQGGADTDFGLRASAAGVPIRQASGTVGECAPNNAIAPWQNARATLGERWRAILGPRGYPIAAWSVFARRHGGRIWPIWLAATYALAASRAIFAARLAHRPGVANVALLEGTLPAYRAQQIAPLAEMADLDATIFAGPARAGASGRVPPDAFALPVRYGRNLYWPGTRERIAWSTGAWTVARSGYDVATMGFHLHDLGIWLVILARLLTGRPRIALSGHYQLWSDGDPITNFKCALRRILARMADAVLPYTEGGGAACRKAGVPKDRIFVIRNTIDVERARRALAQVTSTDIQAWRDSLGIADAPIFLFVGAFYPAKRIDLAARAVAMLRDQGRDCVFVAIGDGGERARIEAAFPPASGVRFLRAEFNETRLAVAFAAAHAVVVPDAVGLIAVHALSYGVPVVTCATGTAHGPEIEYLADGRNALMADELTPESLALAMARLLDQPELRARLVAGARADADTFDVRDSARRFADGLKRASA